MSKFKIVETDEVEKDKFVPVDTEDARKTSVVYSISADQLEADGYFTNITYYAKKVGFIIEVRITPNIVKMLNGNNPDEHISWDEWHDRLDTMLKIIKNDILSTNDTLVESVYEKKRVWTMADSTCGEALHIFTPDEY